MEEKDGFILHICISLTETSTANKELVNRSSDQPQPIRGISSWSPQNNPPAVRSILEAAKLNLSFIHFAVMIPV